MTSTAAPSSLRPFWIPRADLASCSGLPGSGILSCSQRSVILLLASVRLLTTRKPVACLGTTLRASWTVWACTRDGLARPTTAIAAASTERHFMTIPPRLKKGAVKHREARDPEKGVGTPAAPVRTHPLRVPRLPTPFFGRASPCHGREARSGLKPWLRQQGTTLS